MKANPQVGAVYRQEYYQGEAEDMAEVVSLTESRTVPYSSYTDLLVTKEWTPLEPGVAEHKLYAKGVGLVATQVVEGGSGGVELVDITTE